MPKRTPKYYPIIYVRGYAGSEELVEETVATPYMGFNLGSTKLRQDWKGKPKRHIFESPLVRLMKDHGYQDVYEAGDDLPETGRIPAKSVIIYRYYDQVSKDMSGDDAERPDMEVYAKGLSKLIADVRDQVCGKDDEAARAAFRVYLVAHSMGGLICRCFLQNPKMDTHGIRAAVDKVFTYATPHNGIDVRVIGNVPGFFTRNNQDNFNRGKMATYLAIPDGETRVNDLYGTFPPERFFTLVGTNHRDYGVAAGWSRRVVGPMSDGLVRIGNATIRRAPRAFVHRSHSGHYGIVNSESGYQNLSRFLFGDVRVDGRLEVSELTLPPRVQRAIDDDKEVKASYHFETVVRPRGVRYDLHRRTVKEGSAVFRGFDEMLKPEKVERTKPRHPRLFSTFLSSAARTRRGPLVFAVDLVVTVPEYTIDRVLWLDDHIEGSCLYRDTVTIAATPPAGEGAPWKVKYGFDSVTPGRATRKATVETGPDRTVIRIPVRSSSRPGMTADLVLTARKWE